MPQPSQSSSPAAGTRTTAITQTRTRFAGSLGDVAVADLLQTLALNPRGGVLCFDTDVGAGTVCMERGNIVDAEIGSAVGETAVYRLLAASRGTFELKFKAPGRPPRIALSPQMAVMNGLTQLDEWNRDTHHLLAPGCVLRRRDPISSLEVPEVARHVVGLLDGALPLIEFVSAEREARRNELVALTDLVRQGQLDVVLGPPPATTSQVSSHLEGARELAPSGAYRSFGGFEEIGRAHAVTQWIAGLVLVGTPVVALVRLDGTTLLGGQCLGWGLLLVGAASEADGPRFVRHHTLTWLWSPFRRVLAPLDRWLGRPRRVVGTGPGGPLAGNARGSGPWSTSGR